jgi:hypothetical protein
MNPGRHSTSDAGAYRILDDVVAALEQAARELAARQDAAPKAKRRHDLEAIRAAIATLRTVVPASSGDSTPPAPTQDPAETVRDLQRQGEIPAP